MEHKRRKYRYHKQYPVEKHPENPCVYQVKSKKCRIPADLIDSACHQLCFVRFRYPGSPAIPHSKDSENECIKIDLCPLVFRAHSISILLEKVTADSGYCSKKNLLYLKENEITSYIKLQNHEKRKTRVYKEDIGKYYNMTYQVFENEHFYICWDGRELRHMQTENKEQDGYTEWYVRWYERSASQLMTSLLLDCTFFVQRVILRVVWGFGNVLLVEKQ